MSTFLFVLTSEFKQLLQVSNSSVYELQKSQKIILIFEHFSSFSCNCPSYLSTSSFTPHSSSDYSSFCTLVMPPRLRSFWLLSLLSYFNLCSAFFLTKTVRLFNRTIHIFLRTLLQALLTQTHQNSSGINLLAVDSCYLIFY